MVSGRIIEMENPPTFKPYEPNVDSDFPMLAKKDFYKELRLRGYHYTGPFCAVRKAKSDGRYGQVEWRYNWVTFMDAMIQTYILGVDSRNLVLPTRIRRLRINGPHHFHLMGQMDPENRVFDVYVESNYDRIVAGGIEIVGLRGNVVQRRKPPGIPVLEKYQFLPHFSKNSLSRSDAVRVCVQLAMENHPLLKLKIVEVDTDGRLPIIKDFYEAVEDLPMVTGDYTFLSTQTLEDMPNSVRVEEGKLSSQTNCYFIIIGGFNGESNTLIINNCKRSFLENGFLIVRERTQAVSGSFKIPENFRALAAIPVQEDNNEVLVMLQYKSVKKFLADPISVEISDKDSNFLWLQQVQQAIQNNTPVIVYAFNEKLNGLIGLVNCVRKEPNGHLVTGFFIDDKSAPKFNIQDPFYQEQYNLGLAMNVYREVGL